MLVSSTVTSKALDAWQSLDWECLNKAKQNKKKTCEHYLASKFSTSDVWDRNYLQNPLKSVESLLAYVHPFLTLMSVISASCFLQHRQWHSAFYCWKPSQRLFPAQICFEFQVGHWLSKLSCSRALERTLAIDFQKSIAFSPSLQDLQPMDNSVIAVTKDARAGNLWQGTGDDQSLRGNFLLQLSLMQPDLWIYVWFSRH